MSQGREQVDMSGENLRTLFGWVIKAIERLPDPPRKRIKKEILEMEEIMMDNRPPRILILGRRGAGKSSLVNAFFGHRVAKVGSVLSETGEAKWHNVQYLEGSLDILDTRGLGDRTKPETANFEEAIEDIKSAIENRRPDVILFLCKAKEVDAHITQDLTNVSNIKAHISDTYSYEIPVAAVVTQVDELDPKRVEPPYEDAQKQSNISTAVDALKDAFSEDVKIIPVSAYAEYSQDGAIGYDNYWNIDVLLDYLMDVLPNSAQLQLARLSAVKTIQRKLALRVVKSTAAVCAGLASTPIPLADAIPITSAQLAMIIVIGHVAGKKLSKEYAKDFIIALGANVGAALALREGARALVKFVFPIGGHLISAGVAYAGTYAIGKAAIAYFIDEVSIEEVKNRFSKAKAEKAEEYIEEEPLGSSASNRFEC